MPPKKKESFEQSLQRLEEIVKQLEQGEIPLETSLQLFAEGAKLVTQCNEQLDQAQQLVTRIVKQADDSPKEVPFDPEEGEE